MRKEQCSKCGAEARVIGGGFRFRESGLPHVILQGIEIIQCPARGNEDPIIPRLNRFKRGDKFWVSYFAPENRECAEHREPGGATDAETRKLLRQRLREIAVHKSGIRFFLGPKQERTTIEELLQAMERDWQIQGRKGLPRLRSHIKHIRAFVAMDRARAVTPDGLRDYIALRQKWGRLGALLRRSMTLAMGPLPVYLTPTKI